jgi:hypothetical protein
MTRLVSVASVAVAGVLFGFVLARRRARTIRAYQDLAVHARLRTVVSRAKAHWLVSGDTSSTIEELARLDPPAPLRAGEVPEEAGFVYVQPLEDGVMFTARSDSGTGYYLAQYAAARNGGFTFYATDPQCRPASSQTFSPTLWEVRLSRWHRYRHQRRINAALRRKPRNDLHAVLQRSIQDRD